MKLPPGFKIDLYAVVPDARHMAVGPNAGVVFVGTRKTNVYSVTDRDKDRVADEVKVYAAPVELKIPNGLCFSRDGVLYVVEQNRVLQFPAAEFFYEGTDGPAFQVVKQGELIPPAEESYNHTARVCRIGPDNRLYIALGQPFNVPAKEKLDLFRQRWHRRHHQHGPGRQEPAGLHHGHPQLGRHRLQPRRQVALVHRQPGRRHGRRPAAGRTESHHASRPEFRLPDLWRRHGAHGGVQGRSGAAGRGAAAG